MSNSRGHETAFPRRRCVRVLRYPCPSRKQRAQGMPGARRTHCLACKTKKTHAGQHRYAEITPALPAQWFYGCSVISPANLRFATVAFELPRRLVPCIGGTGPHGLTVRVRAERLAA